MEVAPSYWTEYSFTEEEQMLSQLLTEVQQANIRNEVVRLSQRIVFQKHDLRDPLATLVDTVAMQSQVQVYIAQLSNHDSAVNYFNSKPQ
jgi:hypothetical protein